MNTEDDDIMNQILEMNSLKTDPDFDYFFTTYINEPYNLDNKFCQFYWDFGYRINSLYRYYLYSELYLKKLLLKYQEHFRNNWNDDDAFREILYADSEYYYEHHYVSLIARTIALLENLLTKIENDINIDSILAPQKLSKIEKKLFIINHYLSTELINDCKLMKEIKIIVDVRNDSIHSLSKIDNNWEWKEKIEMLRDTVEKCFTIIPEIVHNVENKYWEYNDLKES